MRHITKEQEDIDDFSRWVAGQRNIRTWSDFSGVQAYKPRYLELRDKIVLKEQLGLSAYTEKPLGSNIHIDHFRKQAMYPELTLDYANMLVDDRNDNYGACHKDNQAGGVTRDTFDGPERIFCPVTDNMPDYISFTVNGQIIARAGLSESDKARVIETIRVFNLGHKTLDSSRASVIAMVQAYRDSGEFNDNEIRELLAPMGFPTVVEWALENL